MGWVVAMILGAVAGWAAGLIARVSGGRKAGWLVAVGISGAIVGDALSRPFLGENVGAFALKPLALAAAVLGAIVLIGTVLIVRSGSRI